MKSSNKKIDLREQELLKELQRTQIALETAYNNFENSVDPDLIDCYIYEVNAALNRYKFLLKQVRSIDAKNYILKDPFTSHANEL